MLFKREADLERITLEDFYTIIDLAIARREPIPPYAWRDLIELRRKVDAAILFVCSRTVPEGARAFVQKVAAKLQRKHGDRWATVSLNWDVVWDRALDAIARQNGRRVNYGFPLYRLEGSSGREGAVWSTEMAGPYLLKLHGSFSWARCPICGRVFHLPTETDVWDAFGGLVSCRYCVKAGEERGRGGMEPVLTNVLMTPTMIKRMHGSAPHMVWEGAQRVLSRARRVTVIGYSLPTADFEVRNLLRRHIPASADIQVVVRSNEADKVVADSFSAFLGIRKNAILRCGMKAYFRKRFGI